MRIRTFTGKTLAEALGKVKAELGPEAVLLGNRTLSAREAVDGRRVEVSAAVDGHSALGGHDGTTADLPGRLAVSRIPGGHRRDQGHAGRGPGQAGRAGAGQGRFDGPPVFRAPFGRRGGQPPGPGPGPAACGRDQRQRWRQRPDRDHPAAALPNPQGGPGRHPRAPAARPRSAGPWSGRPARARPPPWPSWPPGSPARKAGPRP